jgi:hypothetical protein
MWSSARVEFVLVLTAISDALNNKTDRHVEFPIEGQSDESAKDELPVSYRRKRKERVRSTHGNGKRREARYHAWEKRSGASAPGRNGQPDRITARLQHFRYRPRVEYCRAHKLLSVEIGMDHGTKHSRSSLRSRGEGV